MRHDDKPDAGDFSVLRARQNGHAVMRRREGDADRLLSDDEHEAIVRRLVAQPAGDGPDRLRTLDAHTFPRTHMGDSRFASGLYEACHDATCENYRRRPLFARVRTLFDEFFRRIAR